MPICLGAMRFVQTSADIFLSVFLLGRPENNTILWNFSRTNNLWEHATKYWDYDLWVSNTRMPSVTVAQIAEEIGQWGVWFGERTLAPTRASTRQSRPDATNRARSFHVARWSLETGTSIPVTPVWTQATGREPFAIDRDQFWNVSCGHGLIGVAQSNGSVWIPPQSLPDETILAYGSGSVIWITCQLDAFQKDAVNFQRANRTRSSLTRLNETRPGRRGYVVKAYQLTWW